MGIQLSLEEAAPEERGTSKGGTSMADNNANNSVAKESSSRKRKTGIAAGVVAAVIIAAGAGFWVWHEQPSFCNAICHVPMDAYYETYADGEYDKFGNALESDEEKMSMAAYSHRVDDGTTCMGCHVPQLSEQISEGLNWMGGAYVVQGENSQGDVILNSRSLAELTEARGIDDEAFCLNSQCHTNEDGTPMTRDDLFEATADLSTRYNPHDNRHGEYSCETCHRAHSQSVNYCATCHEEAPVPNGWLASEN